MAALGEVFGDGVDAGTPCRLDSARASIWLSRLRSGWPAAFAHSSACVVVKAAHHGRGAPMPTDHARPCQVRRQERRLAHEPDLETCGPAAAVRVQPVPATQLPSVD